MSFKFDLGQAKTEIFSRAGMDSSIDASSGDLPVGHNHRRSVHECTNSASCFRDYFLDRKYDGYAKIGANDPSIYDAGQLNMTRPECLYKPAKREVGRVPRPAEN